MAKGFEANQERLKQLSLLGKELTRRSRARCELCGQSGVALSLFEVPPAPQVPDLDKVLHLCGDCSTQLEKPKNIQVEHWRILAETIWSEVPAAQVMAVRILKFLATKEPWAQEILENAFLDEELEEWVGKESLN